jgi:hypothetical protein
MLLLVWSDAAPTSCFFRPAEVLQHTRERQLETKTCIVLHPRFVRGCDLEESNWVASKLTGVQLSSRSDRKLYMPIALPCGQVLKSNLLSELLQDPQLRQSSQEFFAKPNNPVPATVRSLCCLQGEAATVCFQNQPDIVIGSTDATTCLIVAALCPQTRKVNAKPSSACK